jgi:hypothetical protein
MIPVESHHGSRLTDAEKEVLRAALMWACVPAWGSYDDTGQAVEDTCEELGSAVEHWIGRRLPKRKRDTTLRVDKAYYPKGSR